jgi:CPA2 family monovalent cation:H+ antiporter-2
VLGKLVVWTVIARLFRYPMRTALLIAVGLTQIGEFSYVLLQVARNANLVDAAIYNATLMASLISIFINVMLVRFASPRLWRGPEYAKLKMSSLRTSNTQP